MTQDPGFDRPRPGALSRTEARRQIEDLAVRLANRLAALDVRLEGGGLAATAKAGKALDLMLAATDAKARRHAANIIAAALLDLGERNDPEWWRTHLGRVLAREVGWWAPWPSRKVAEAVLDVSKQAIAQMIQRGELEERREDGQPAGITALSLQEAVEKRWPREADLT